MTTLARVESSQAIRELATFPRYDRAQLQCGIAHLGVGNFHRAHQALYLHQLLQEQSQNWMIHGVGTLPGDKALVEAMTAQHCLYTLTERSNESDTVKVIGSIRQMTHAASEPAVVSALLASKATRIISMTVTEKGYCNTASGELDVEHPSIRADLVTGAIPVSALGHLYRAAEHRWTSGGAKFTVASCDNMPGNGTLTRRLLLQFAGLLNQSVRRWIEENVSFPNSMVDRITPAVTAETGAYVRATLGVDDRCPVASESFLQWVMEDDFVAGRPELERVGVQLVRDVHPYEVLKIRMLNSSHSALAYLSYLMGHRAVDEAMSDAVVHRYVERYMDEDITPGIPSVPGIALDRYKKVLRDRFGNRALRDQIQRLAMDGSTKVRTFIVPAVEAQLALGGSLRWLAFAVAAWCRYLRGVDEMGMPIEINDANLGRLQARLGASSVAIDGVLALSDVFGPVLPGSRRWLDEVRSAFEAIEKQGTRRALESRLAGE